MQGVPASFYLPESVGSGHSSAVCLTRSGASPVVVFIDLTGNNAGTAELKAGR